MQSAPQDFVADGALAGNGVGVVIWGHKHQTILRRSLLWQQRGGSEGRWPCVLNSLRRRSILLSLSLSRRLTHSSRLCTTLHFHHRMHPCAVAHLRVPCASWQLSP